ncbi:hypothetical protein [Bacteroides bouchesdurhonensis]|uniref:hypothetical protein n=1 Tax=Bacteroides bouchesdurhonensis TaxID=1841855 RepID=UPI0022E0F3F7|nr:hypothetical protein [Bacteroides bouchesdurhonensis]
MENQKKPMEEVLKERIENLEQENKKLTEVRDMYEGLWRKADAKNLELLEAVKSISTISNLIYNSAKS